ncbi:mannose-6-phosphate isomerase-like protein (cupin superfamily) [Cytobacillus horneckiae]|uniref:Cupin domain-containing protein n=1 Tax=Cytobacillus horneckiae TaxID=549687 RepID=A0A2N0ZCF5_9BACI|nr:cupin domain-containing protein [Cytobacillus horneckiae]MBN6889786.1 cupin domain-containing protein [Cytobacillus horneckiae]MCM3180886.1 cupin domain-containing protein [Cytobacillus horneckiae]MEC1158565.1 cupin domain-containing protein [Cytobacillus horneckiae]MED2940850.1 cupin domain-containing protein [Cytobacillus horneckiae]PKG27196.1 cupin domain-containing protein [Cytobacillus horneckiae]
MPILFSFGLTCNLDTAKKDLEKWNNYSKAVLKDHIYTFTGFHPDFNGGTSTVIHREGGEVIGVAFDISEEQINLIKDNDYGYVLKQKEIFILDKKVSAYTMEPKVIEELMVPSLSYYEGVKEALTQHYPKEIVNRYLDRALKRTKKKGVNIQRNNPDSYKHEYGSLLRRIYPWDIIRNSPFGSGIIVVPPGEATEPHNHDEEETFIIIEGEGIINVDGETEKVYPEDVIYFEPFSVHSLHNIGKKELKFLAVWWGAVGVQQYQLENRNWRD